MKRIQKILCMIFGHKYMTVTTKDNDWSIFGHVLCQRCGAEENYQCDYRTK